MNKLAVIIPTCNSSKRRILFASVLTSVLLSKIKDVCIISDNSLGDDPQFKLVISALKDSGSVVVTYEDNDNKYEKIRRGLIWLRDNKYETALIMDDDIFILPSSISSGLNLLKNTPKINVLAFMQVLPSLNKVTAKFKDKFHNTLEDRLIKQRYAGGAFLIRNNVALNYDFKIRKEQPGGDRLLFKGVKGIYLWTKLVAYHLTSKDIGSYYNYKKYFKEPNKVWEMTG